MKLKTTLLGKTYQFRSLKEVLAKKLDSITEKNWQMLPLHVEFQGAHIVSIEE